MSGILGDDASCVSRSARPRLNADFGERHFAFLPHGSFPDARDSSERITEVPPLQEHAPPLGSYCRPVSRISRGSWGVGPFPMSEVPLQAQQDLKIPGREDATEEQIGDDGRERPSWAHREEAEKKAQGCAHG